MSETSPEATTARHPRVRIDVPGDVLEQRRVFAEETLGVNDRTVARMRLPTCYVANVAYIFRNRSLKIIAERGVRNAGEPARSLRRGPYRSK